MKPSKNKKEILHHANDKLLKIFFSDVDNMRDFLQSSFPKRLAEQMHWNYLNKQNGSFIDDSMRSIV